MTEIEKLALEYTRKVKKNTYFGRKYNKLEISLCFSGFSYNK